MSQYDPCYFRLMIAAALMLSMLTDAGFCDDNGSGDLEIDIDFTDPADTFENFAYLGTYDKRGVANFGNKNLDLTTFMNNNLEFDTDGSIKKTQFRALYSNGSELLNIDEVSSFYGYDQLGNKYSSRKQSTISLTNFDFPFTILSEEIILLDGDDLDWRGTSTQNYLLIPNLSADEYSQVESLFGGFGRTQIINIGNETALSELDLGQFFGDDEMDRFLEPLRNKEMWSTIRDMAQQYVDEQERKKAAMREIATDFSSSSGGITCIWGYRE